MNEEQVRKIVEEELRKKLNKGLQIGEDPIYIRPTYIEMTGGDLKTAGLISIGPSGAPKATITWDGTDTQLKTLGNLKLGASKILPLTPNVIDLGSGLAFYNNIWFRNSLIFGNYPSTLTEISVAMPGEGSAPAASFSWHIIANKDIQAKGGLFSEEGHIYLGNTVNYEGSISLGIDANIYRYTIDVLKTDDNFIVGGDYLNVSPPSLPKFNLQEGTITKAMFGYDGTDVYISAEEGNLNIGSATANVFSLGEKFHVKHSIAPAIINLMQGESIKTMLAWNGTHTVLSAEVGDLILSADSETIRPFSSGSITLGDPSYKWENIYAVTITVDNMPPTPPSAHATSHLIGGTDALTVGVPVDVGTSNAEGSDTIFVRRDHVHKHPQFTTGDLHQDYILASGARAFSNTLTGNLIVAGYIKAPDGDIRAGKDIVVGETSSPYIILTKKFDNSEPYLEVGGAIYVSGDMSAYGFVGTQEGNMYLGGTLLGPIRIQRAGDGIFAVAYKDTLDVHQETGRITKAGQLQLPMTDGAYSGVLMGGDVLLYRSAADVLTIYDNVEVRGPNLNIDHPSANPVFNLQLNNDTKIMVGWDGTDGYINAEKGNLNIGSGTANVFSLAEKFHVKNSIAPAIINLMEGESIKTMFSWDGTHTVLSAEDNDLVFASDSQLIRPYWSGSFDLGNPTYKWRSIYAETIIADYGTVPPGPHSDHPSISIDGTEVIEPDIDFKNYGNFLNDLNIAKAAPVYLRLRTSGGTDRLVLQHNGTLASIHSNLGHLVLSMPSGSCVKPVPDNTISDLGDSSDRWRYLYCNFVNADQKIDCNTISPQVYANQAGINHGNLSGLDDESDHTWAALTSGARDFTGDVIINKSNPALQLEIGGAWQARVRHNASHLVIDTNTGNIILDPVTNVVRADDTVTVLGATSYKWKNIYADTITVDNMPPPGDHAGTHVQGGGDPLSVGIPVDIGTSNQEGSATNYVRRDHVHNHPTFASGDYHQVYALASGARDFTGDVNINKTSPAFRLKVGGIAKGRLIHTGGHLYVDSYEGDILLTPQSNIVRPSNNLTTDLGTTSYKFGDVYCDQINPETYGNQSQINHDYISGVTTSDHHVKTVSSEILLNSLGEKNHSSLAGVTSAQHHTKTTDAGDITSGVFNQARIPWTGISNQLLPTSAGYYNIGSSSMYWAEINYKTLEDRGCIVDLDPKVALAAVLATKKSNNRMSPKGMLVMDYTSFPDFIKDIPEKIPQPIYEYQEKDGKMIKKKIGEAMPEDGLDVSGLVSLLLASTKELTRRIEQLEAEVEELRR